MLTPESLTLDLEQNRISPVQLTGMLVALQRKIAHCKFLLNPNIPKHIAFFGDPETSTPTSLHIQIAELQELLDIIYFHHPELLL